MMSDLQQRTPDMFEAFIKSAQYFVRLNTQQDIWEHLGRFLITYFPAEWVAFVERDTANALSILHGTAGFGLPGASSRRPCESSSTTCSTAAFWPCRSSPLRPRR